jgi:hypothetical protein
MIWRGISAIYRTLVAFGSAKANRGKSKSYLGSVFNFKLGSFVS